MLDPSSIIPIRGPMASVVKTFSKKVNEDELPNVLSLRTAGGEFQISRHFATSDKEGNAEKGNLTISTKPINNNSYS